MRKTHLSALFITALCTLLLGACQQKPIPVPSDGGCPLTLKHQLRALNSTKVVDLCKAYQDKVVLIVNTASKCGFTDQYDGLEKLYARYKDRGLVVLGFPSNDFANQEPGNEQQVQEFCRLTYGVQFPMFSKTHVTREQADPVYRILGELSGTYPKWNFYKYLLDRQGNIVGVYSSFTAPDNSGLIDNIEKHLAQ